jgi:PAS domain S-box-containing protein
MNADQIVERALGPAVATDSDNRILSWNQAARRLFGYNEKQAVAGKRLHELLTIIDTFGNPYKSDGQPFWELATRGEPVNSFELQVPQREGPSLRLSVSAVVVLGPTEGEYSVVYLMRPIYRRRRADEAIDRILSMSMDELRTIGADGAPRAAIERQLTRREVEVLRLLAQGNSSEEIAHTLNLSVYTVRSHIQHMLSKLEAHSKLEAVTKALQMRLI